MAKEQKPECTGECHYHEQWVDNLRDFETIEFRWYDREITIVKGVSGPGRDALNQHAAELKVGYWIKWCNEKQGCHCEGKWLPESVTTITLVDHEYGANAICKADLHKRDYVGKCEPQKKG
jgi:hypothetical protein